MGACSRRRGGGAAAGNRHAVVSSTTSWSRAIWQARVKPQPNHLRTSRHTSKFNLMQPHRRAVYCSGQRNACSLATERHGRGHVTTSKHAQSRRAAWQAFTESAKKGLVASFQIPANEAAAYCGRLHGRRIVCKDQHGCDKSASKRRLGAEGLVFVGAS